jgi:hypothetical protein
LGLMSRHLPVIVISVRDMISAVSLLVMTCNTALVGW